MKFYQLAALTSVAAATLFAGQASATTISVPNYSFELPNTGSYTIDNITDWGGYPSTGQWGTQISTTAQYPGGVPDGSQFAYTNNSGIYLSDAAFSAANLLQVGTYVLTVDVGSRLDFAFTGNADVRLFAGATEVADTLASAPTAGTFALATVTYVVAAGNPNIGQSLGIELDGQAVGGSGQVDWDLVTLDYETPASPTPLPAALPLFASGLGAMGLFGWHRKRKNAAVPTAA